MIWFGWNMIWFIYNYYDWYVYISIDSVLIYLFYVNWARSAAYKLKLLITSDNSKKTIKKLDNVCMIYVLHTNYEPVQSYILMAYEIPSTKNLISHLTRLSSPGRIRVSAPQNAIESFAFASYFSSCGRWGRGHGVIEEIIVEDVLNAPIVIGLLIPKISITL